MNKLVYTHAAQGDLVGFYEATAAQSGEVASAADVQALLDRCEDLARYPDMGRRRTELDALGLQARSVSQGQTTIVYTRRGNTVCVVRILRGA